MEARATTDTQAWTLQFCKLPPPAPLAARSHPCLVRAGLAHTVLQQLLPGSLPTERLSHLQRPPRDHRQWRCGDSPGRRSALPPGPGPAANGPKSGLRWIHSCESGRASWTWGSTLPHGRRLEKGPSWCKEKGAWGGEGQVGLRARATWGAGTPQWLRVTPLPSRGPGPLPPPLTFQGLPFPRVPGRGECWIGWDPWGGDGEPGAGRGPCPPPDHSQVSGRTGRLLLEVPPARWVWTVGAAVQPPEGSLCGGSQHRRWWGDSPPQHPGHTCPSPSALLAPGKVQPVVSARPGQQTQVTISRAAPQIRQFFRKMVWCFIH